MAGGGDERASRCRTAGRSVEIESMTIASVVGVGATGKAIRGARGSTLVGAEVVGASRGGVTSLDVTVVLLTTTVGVATGITIRGARGVTLIGAVVIGATGRCIAGLNVAVLLAAAQEVDPSDKYLFAILAAARLDFPAGEDHITRLGDGMLGVKIVEGKGNGLTFIEGIQEAGVIREVQRVDGIALAEEDSV